MENLLRMFLGRNISTVYKNTSKGATCRRPRGILHADGRLDFFHLFQLLCRETGSILRHAFWVIRFRIEPATSLVRSICSTPPRHRGFGEVGGTLVTFNPGKHAKDMSILFFRLSRKILVNSKYRTDGSWPNARIASGE